MMKPEFEIVFAEKRDIEEILSLQCMVTKSIKIKEWFVPSTLPELELAFSHQDKFPALKVMYRNEIVAFSYIILNPDNSNDISQDIETIRNKNCCVYETVFVSPECRGCGLQFELISRLTNIAQQNGKSFIVAIL